ncbi:hypothetical protein ONZ43_g1135 [Nemania bipapillata]|uniref:Uncharacterized protein n=1 Tax=Nemania bipapillata TaxID=110536 RepID=A0ACC2J5L7_9PEZI|nr:hypothetical protein ONZ43_g1135 [Nemania bipapillata]
MQDLKRYAIVSIFLHYLDDSDALTLMTTTRVDLDPAFESRVDMAIPLPNISFEAQKRIWKTAVTHIGVNLNVNKVMRFIDCDLETAEQGSYTAMNGRQICSCIAAAAALARQSNETFATTHIRDVLKLGREFRELMDKTPGNARAQMKHYARLVPQ